MKRINTIIESSTPPPHGKHTLWLKSKEDGSKELVYNGDKVGSDLDKTNIFYTKFPFPNPAFLAFMSTINGKNFVPFGIYFECSGELELVRTTWNLRDCLYYRGIDLWLNDSKLVDSEYIEDIIALLDKTGEISPYFHTQAFGYINCDMAIKIKDSDQFLINNLTHPIKLPCSDGWITDEINSWTKFTLSYKGNGNFKIGYH